MKAFFEIMKQDYKAEGFSLSEWVIFGIVAPVSICFNHRYCMNDIQVFNNEQFGTIRTAGTAEQPLFCLADICKVLELQTGATKNRLDQKGVNLINTPTSSGEQQMIFVNEKNLYRFPHGIYNR